jgi:methane/ammonia monooxygenase subunit B
MLYIVTIVRWIRQGKIYIVVLSQLFQFNMVDKKFIVAAISVIVALGAVGPSMAQMFQHAEAHGVQAQLQSRFVRIDGETWSKQSVHTGDTLSVSGKFVSLVNRDLRGWYTVYGDSPNAGNRWEIVARDPPGNVITIPANGVVDYKLTIKALEPAVYHMHTQLNIASIGPGLGPGQTVVVTGDPIVKPIPYTNVIYQSIVIGVGYAVTFATRPWQVI